MSSCQISPSSSIVVLSEIDYMSDSELKTIDQGQNLNSDYSVVTNNPNAIENEVVENVPLPFKISSAIKWILENNKSDEKQNLLTQISACHYNLLLLIYGLTHKDTSFIEMLSFLKDSPPEENDWTSFREVILPKFDLTTEMVYDIFVCSLEDCLKLNIKIPMKFLNLMSIFGERKGLLLMAASFNKVEIVKVLLQFGFDINERDADENTALHIAASNGHIEVVELLLSKGAWHFALNTDGYTPVWLALINKHLQVSKVLLERTPNVNTMLPENRTLIRLAVESNFEEIVQILIQKRANLHLLYNDGSSFLHFAAQKGFTRVAEILASSGIGVNHKNKLGRTAIHDAATNNFYEIIEILFCQGADVNELDSFKNSPVLLAVKNKCREAAEILLALGADAKIGNCNQEWPILAAISAGDVALVKMLKSFGAHINCSYGTTTPILLAVDTENPTMVKTLFDLGADLNKREGAQPSLPLLRAVKTGNIEVIKTLIECGADINVCDYTLGTSLHIAASYGFIEVIDLLLSKNADINMLDGIGRGPIHHAILSDNFPAVKHLMQAGASLTPSSKWIYKSTSRFSGKSMDMADLINIAKSEEIKQYINNIMVS